ncbi:MAG: carboxypeptidase regulatory-like domain-containing protein [Chlorobi bacterium]|nr:carboxypeptidase regulatory-like domain-containing protein [Chlorobiota bacterium]
MYKPMKRYKLIQLTILLALISTFLLTACKDSPTSNKLQYPPDNESKVTITQGVWGNVWFWEGNFMPIVDPDHARITPVIRKIYVYEATNDSMVERSGIGPFFSKINSKLITTLSSGIDGFYQVSLPPGKYSFFVKEDSLFYANGWDGEGDILSAVVTENNIVKNQIDITYKAAF